MIAFNKSTMKKFKTQYLLCFLMLCLVEVGFSQNVRFQSDLTKKDNLWYSGEDLYTGEAITLSQDQIETRCSIEKGVPSGLFTKYFLDNTFKKSNYKDTSEIRRLNQEIVIENNKLNSLIKDSLLAYNELISYINNEIGGDKKLQKLVEKKEANKLNEKQKVLMDNFVSKRNFWKNSAKNVLLSQQKIKLTNTKLKEEEAKPIVAPKIAEQYEQINSIKNGSYKSYYNDGKLKSEGTFLNGLYNGAWIYYYSNGNEMGRGSYIAGDGTDVSELSGLPRNGRDGLWKFYNVNGKVKQEANYIKGKLNGSFKEYNDFGELILIELYQNGLINGKQERFNNQKIKISEANFIKGIAEGEEKIYYDSGKLKIQRSYKQGKLDGVAKGYFENGKTSTEENFKVGKQDGLCKKYFESGSVSEEANYKDGYINGQIKVYYVNGNVKIIGEGNLECIGCYTIKSKFNEDGSPFVSYWVYSKDEYTGKTEVFTGQDGNKDAYIKFCVKQFKDNYYWSVMKGLYWFAGNKDHAIGCTWYITVNGIKEEHIVPIGNPIAIPNDVLERLKVSTELAIKFWDRPEYYIFKTAGTTEALELLKKS
jgi:antitoxin component YwqK of YwqJK toxin-antitoxin module